MILNLPYAYTMWCVPPGCVHERAYDVRGLAPVDVPVATGGEAPVSCRFRGDEFRSFEGRCYGLLLSSDEEPVDAEGMAAYFATPQFDGKLPDMDGQIGYQFAGRDAHAASPFTRPTVDRLLCEVIASSKRGFRAPRDMRDDSVEASWGAARVWEKSLLVIDGQIWVRAPEPRLLVEYRGGRFVRVDLATRPSEDAKWSVPFRADAYRDALAFAKGMAERVRGRHVLPECGEDDVEVVDADALSLDEAVELAKFIDDSMGPFADRGMAADFRDLRTVRMERGPDRAWAREFLDYPDLRKVQGHARGDFAADRKALGAAIGVAIDAWETHFRAKATEAEQALDEDEEILGMVP